MTPLVRELASLDEYVALNYHWFDLGIIPSYRFEWRDLPGSRIPFDHCAIACRDKNGDKILLLAEQADESTYLLAAWMLLPDRFTRTPLFAVVMDEDKGGCYVAGVEGEDEISKESAAPFVGILAEFLKDVHPSACRAVTKRNSITNARRAKHGKAPLIYDWHTVTIEPADGKGECLGETHASPRRHDRRGHWRTCANGKRVWVRNCVVGNAAHGTVFKDYRVVDKTLPGMKAEVSRGRI